jgi:hypothetical protein
MYDRLLGHGSMTSSGCGRNASGGSCHFGGSIGRTRGGQDSLTGNDPDIFADRPTSSGAPAGGRGMLYAGRNRADVRGGSFD